VAVLVGAAGCSRGFQVRDYPTPVQLYLAGLAELQAGNAKNAVTALDQVVVLLGPRDTLLPRAYWYLGRAHDAREHHLLASKAYEDLFRNFQEDTLADDALLAMADAEARQWRRPDLDPEHGQKAAEAYVTFQRLFPSSPLLARAQAGERRLLELFARKDYDVGMGLMRRRAFDSALIYFGDVVENYPGTEGAHDAAIRMVEIYRRLRYTADAADTCRVLRATYPNDSDVRSACSGIAVDTTG
jgi:outer membrane assembly lipoprotein YfiO